MAQPTPDPAPQAQGQAPDKPDADALKASKTALRLIAEINAAEKAQQKWLTRARKINRVYRRSEQQNDAKRKFAMLWSNTETVRPAIYARPPEPVVQRRFDVNDPVGRVTSEVLERAIKYSIDAHDLDGALKSTSLDFVLIARAITWERYVPTFGPEVTPKIPLQVKTEGDDPESAYHEDAEGNRYDPADVQYDGEGDEAQPYANGAPYRPVTYEESVTDYVNWEDFGHNAARTWDEVDLVYRRVYLGRDELVDRFGEQIGSRVPLDWGQNQGKPRSVEDETTKKAAIYEVWCKSAKKVYWISKGFTERPLDEIADPLKLDGFFPCPRPLLGTIGNDSLLPTPDYIYYQDQAEEVDDLTAKIAVLQKALKVVGFSAGEDFSKLVNLMNADNSTLIAVPDWLRLKEGGGVKGMIEWWPIDLVVQALQAMINQRQQLINDIYQITGIADVLRGMNDPRATATAEQIKGQWGTLRIRDRQKEMQRYARDLLRIKGGVIAGQFSIETLKAMTEIDLPMAAVKQAVMMQLQQQAMAAQAQAQAQAAAQAQMAGPMPGGAVPGPGPQSAPGGPPMGAAPPQPPAPPPPPQPTDQQKAILASPTWEDVLARLRDNALRCFTIDIETDSTVEPNEAEEKAQATEFITAMGNMIAQWGTAIKEEPALAPLAGEMIKWGARKFHAARTLEGVVDSVVDSIVAKAGAAPPPGAQQPPPDPAKQAAAQAQVQVAAMEQQTEMAQIQQKREEAQGKLAVEQGNLALRSQELQLQRGDQQLKVVAMSRDPQPQVIQ